MSEAGEEAQSEKQVTFNVKSSSDSKYVVTVPENITVLDLKTKLSTSEYADTPADRQRLIYSGRVLKNEDSLSTYKIKDGNTVHMVKGAASNQRQNPANSSSSESTGPSNPAANVPSNIATGTGTDPLAGLTGARYAGFAQMPSAESFGADGGMGPPQSPDDMLRMMENPMFQSQMNEAMNNPHVIQMMQNSPMIRNNPWLRQMLENPEMRRMMMDPQMIRQSMQMRGAMGGGGMEQGQAGMPAPGVTDTTPEQQEQQRNQETDSQNQGVPIGGIGGGGAPQMNPFGILGQQGGGMGMGVQQGNPFAQLFGGGAGGGMGSPPPNPFGQQPSPNPQSQQPGQTGDSSQQNQGNQQQQNQQQNPLQGMAQQMMQNPEMMRMAMQMMGGAGGAGGMPGQDQQGGQANPFGMPMPGMFGQEGGLGGSLRTQAQQAQQQQQDTRPPEEQFSDQLRQLNEMGFFEFERNVRALRMAGGNVSGAIEMLLSGTI